MRHPARAPAGSHVQRCSALGVPCVAKLVAFLLHLLGQEMGWKPDLQGDPNLLQLFDRISFASDQRGFEGKSAPHSAQGIVGTMGFMDDVKTVRAGRGSAAAAAAVCAALPQRPSVLVRRGFALPCAQGRRHQTESLQMQWAQPATRLIMHVAPRCDALRSGCAGLRSQPVPASLRGPEASQREQLLRTSQELPTSQLSVVGSLIFRPGTPCAGPDSRAQAKQLCVPRVVGAARARMCSVHLHLRV
jgi:hypothetical protein